MPTRTRAAIAAALGATLCLTAVPAAHADPSGAPTYRQLAGVGADDTAGLMDAIANDVTVNGVKALGSYDPTGSTLIQTQAPAACSISRPDGSVAGRRALIYSIVAKDGCVQYATSSNLDLSFIGTGIHPDTQLTYVPFADDAVTYAVTSTSQLPRQLALADLQAIYTCNPTVVGTYPNYTIHALLPQPGSGLRAFWEQRMGITEGDVVAGKYGCISDKANGAWIDEEDGRVLGDTSVVPFSIASYDSEMGQVVVDLRGHAMLGTIDGYAPTAPNPAFPAALSGYTYAVADDSMVPRQLATADLQQIYRCNPAYVGNGPYYTIHPLLPAEGTSARTTWESAMGITDAQVTSGQLPCISDVSGGAPVGADDGRAVITADELMPYSISVYGKQTSEQVSDIHGETVLGSIDGVGPQVYNPSFEITRENYNVIPTADTATQPYSSVFVGSGSLVCADTAEILRYGFVKAPDCGSTTNVTAP